jgi:hypothetical protein
MRHIRQMIDRRIYDTAASLQLATVRWTGRDGVAYTGEIWQTRLGRYFTTTRWTEPGRHGRRLHELGPLTFGDAERLLGTIGKPGGLQGEVLIDPFADGAEAAFAELRLRLPATLKHRVDMTARRAGVSVNRWLLRTVEAALATQPGVGPMISMSGGPS